MKETYPDISEILAQKAEGRRERARLRFEEKLAVVDALRERIAPIVRARSALKDGHPTSRSK
jgi:hypothetical protein